MHVDVSFKNAQHFNSSLLKLSEKINNRSIIAFHHRANIRFKNNSDDKVYDDVLERFQLFDNEDPGFCTFSLSDISKDGKIL